jgi:probable rRNA maturation factor
METDRIARPTAPPLNSIEVEVTNNQAHLEADPRSLAELARRVFARHGVARATLSIVLVDDATIHAINRRHLAHDWPTDVITFTLSEPDEPELSAELVVSAEMASATAIQAGVDPRSELALYVVHGVLHLCGFDDQSPAAAAQMRQAEADALAEEGLVNTFSLVGADRPDDEGREMMRWPH